MKVLWFSNAEIVGSNKDIGCSWISSLEAEISKVPDIHLGIVFNSNQFDSWQFKIGNTSYFPVRTEPVRNKFKKLYNRFKHNIEDENIIQFYLNIVQEFKPDIIHIFGTESDFGLLIPRTNIPCVIHLQGNLTLNDHKWFIGLSALDILRHSDKLLLLKGHGLFHGYWVNKKSAAREKRIFKACKYFMGRTDFDRRLSSVLSPDSEYFHCEEMIRPAFYLNEWRSKKADSDFVIMSTIRNNIYKGLETILECKIILNQLFTGCNIIWKIAGLKEEYEISYLVERIYKTKFRDIDIQLLGPLQEDELIGQLVNADLYIHPSHIENSPNGICEAMLLGMPVIATYAGGTPGILTDRKEGLLVQDGDPYSLAGAIIELIKDRNFANKLGINGRLRARIRHEPRKIVEDLLNIYSSILLKNDKLDKLAI